MSSGITESIVTNPYRGVLPFRYADRSLFFGREKVIENLYAKILLYKLVILFGQSGAGKSSVINAGIIPALKKEGCQAEHLRVSPEYENSPILVERIEGDAANQESFLPSIFSAEQTDVRKGLERIPLAVDEFFDALRRVPQGTIPLLIFDQFEELFTLFSPKGDEKDKQKLLAQGQILKAINELAHDEDSEVKILLIIREDFLGKLEVFARKYPEIFDHRVRLGHLDTTEAKQAIVGPFREDSAFNSKITESLANTIVKDLSLYEDQGVVPATQLQIVCDRLWQNYVLKLKRPEITEKEFEAEGKVKGLLEGYLTSELEKLGVGCQPQAIRILANLITDSDTRDIVSKDKLKSLLNSQDNEHMETLDAILEILEKRRIINRTTQRDNFYYEVASEYLIHPIKREKQRLLYDQTRRRLRNWWVKVLAGVIIALSTPTYWAYTVWKENQPWGYLANLSTRSIHGLTGGVVSIGRSANDFKNVISLSPRQISRMHLFVSREHIAIDVRSLNGTTVNSTFLPYGSSRKLEDGDIVALAGIAPFRFSVSPMQVTRPSSAWAMIIDGKAKTHHYMNSDHYVLVLNPDGTLAVSQENGTKGLLSIEKTENGMAIKDAEDSHDLRVEMRLGDYTYVSCKIPPGQLFENLDVRKLDQYRRCEVLTGRTDLNDITQFEHSLFTVTYKYSDTSFQLVPIVPGLEVSTPPS